MWDFSNFTWCLTLLQANPSTQHEAEELLHALTCRVLLRRCCKSFASLICRASGTCYC